MKILKATVVRLGGPDIVYLETTLPSPTPAVSTDNLSFRFDAAADSGPAFVREHFGLEAQVIDARSRKIGQ